MRVHQFHPTIVPRDAISNHVLALDRAIHSWGRESYVYAIEAGRGLDTQVLPHRRLFRSVAPSDVLVLHFSTGNELFNQLVKIPAMKVLVYHNITPPAFFIGINPHAALHAQMGLRQLRSLAGKVDLAIGVSEFNRRELAEAGFARTEHVPLLVDWDAYDVAPDDAVMRAWSDGATKLLFVGRISPHKRQDDLIRLLAYYRRCIEPRAALVLVGSHREQPHYFDRLRALAEAAGVADGVIFAGGVSMPELVAHYRTASCFVSLSEHEGFAVPLLEAMRFGVPVVAYDAGAVAETLDGAGLLFEKKDLAEIAEACQLIRERQDLHDRLAGAGDRRLSEFTTARVATLTKEVLGL